MIYGFLLAVQFLTRIPVPVECPWNERTSRWAIRFYPTIGIVIGGILVGIGLLLISYVPAEFLTLIIISLWVWLTGGLHLDGLMDVADAVGSNAPLEKKWQIMKDPHVGSFGIITLFFLLIWKTMMIYLLLSTFSTDHLIGFLVIGALARFAAVALLVFLPTAKKQGLAWHWKQNISVVDAAYSFIPIIILLMFLPEYIVIVPIFLLFLWLYSLWVMRSFKGINGDLIGTAIEGGEICALLLVWIFISFVMG
ncbi:adenosylcobinamide-GDP ribazoletransferase [Salipaludibacillus daqingensis]|uniref:adenosylcobinamide-GDP ribazoletransferase n=1 Tax=Salipaludibacillus daqingensis TaxID=3041001 RepID=UPI0024740381|nr:adenosylcobinamide-GDP ribazoletransferase [Salipaludibacillus daqingensis]